MAVCSAQTLLEDASTNGFTKLSNDDALSVMLVLAQAWEGGTDSASQLLSAAALNEFLFLSNEGIWDCLCQKACDIANP